MHMCACARVCMWDIWNIRISLGKIEKQKRIFLNQIKEKTQFTTLIFKNLTTLLTISGDAIMFSSIFYKVHFYLLLVSINYHSFVIMWFNDDLIDLLSEQYKYKELH